jgi:hypothetical protein
MEGGERKQSFLSCGAKSDDDYERLEFHNVADITVICYVTMSSLLYITDALVYEHVLYNPTSNRASQHCTKVTEEPCRWHHGTMTPDARG